MLRPGDFPLWDDLVSRSPHGTVFHYSWWLEATGCKFEILVCRDEEGKLVAGIPLPRRRRAGLVLFHSPDLLTPFLGPVFDLSEAEYEYEKVTLMRERGELLARAIDGYDSFSYGVGPSAPDLQGFLWAGFRVELSYTFRFRPGGPPDGILAGSSQEHQRNLAKAHRQGLNVVAGDDLESLVRLVQQTYRRQGLVMPFEEDVLRRLAKVALARGHAKVYLAQTREGRFAAGLLVVHDGRSSYQLVAGGDPALRALGGGNLVEWEAIQESLAAGRTYDFEGSEIRGVERHYRRWGAVPTPTWRLERAGSVAGALARALRKLKSYRSAF
jgi:hypothetical protein